MKCCVQGSKLVDEHPHGPAIADDMVHCQHKHVLFRLKAYERRTEQRSFAEIEGGRRLFLSRSRELRRSLGWVEEAQITHRQGPLRRRVNHLHHLAFVLREARAKHLVPAHDLLEGPAQCLRIERAMKAYCDRNMIRDA